MTETATPPASPPAEAAAAAAKGAEKVDPAAESSVSQNRRKILAKREKLPVWSIKQKFLTALAKHQLVFVAAPPASGKSTQIPQFVFEGGFAKNGKQIACTQPRKIVAKALASHVAKELDAKLGEEVGYSVLFEDFGGQKTCIKYLTDGVLLREVQSNACLENYQVIILDEVHLRTLATDILLAYFKTRLLIARPELKLVIMSTQPEAKKFLDYFNQGQIVQPVVKLHPVEVVYSTNPVADPVEAAVERVKQILVTEPAGDVVVFLTGMEEIETCCWRLVKLIEELGDKVGPTKVIPLHCNMSADVQKNVFKGAPPPTRKGGPPGRKVVVTTELAESSIAITGFVYVIDCGYTKQKVYNAQLQIESLLILPISKASAQSRSGCARRLAPGRCFRLYSKEFFKACQPHVSPEVLRANFAGTLLQIKKLGFSDLSHLNLMDLPAEATIVRALESLKCLGALDEEESLTELGKLMTEFPFDPQMSKVIVSSPKFCCSQEILSIAAMLSVPDCFLRPLENQQAADEARANFYHSSGDHITLLNAYNAFTQCNGDSTWCEKNYINRAALISAINVRKKLVSIMQKHNLGLVSIDFKSKDFYGNIIKCLLAGYFMQAAHLDLSGQYLTAKDHHVVDIHPTSSLISRPACVIFNDFVLASRNFIRMVSSVEPDWLVDIAPHYYPQLQFDEDQNFER